MTELDRLQKLVNELDVATSPYKPFCYITPASVSRWRIAGLPGRFTSIKKAVENYKEQAAGRRVHIVINDLPPGKPIECASASFGALPVDEIKRRILSGESLTEVLPWQNSD